ncbi:Release factor glutamine methyltransferase [Candidatus Xiphinematobacter sp. Idaho Grape]|uniref:peptide chain release factor N(5)-glutamine methyltransferase n=1 Tax=Candidatus Xiphinematobacter sp. Idaho Grape TaxID=1704307 RepID=UPI0007067A1C|nr:peptide chain release factor N(5)-glutamine methyltransferase [Candidatus Xiphinematobacter sp. Idaho Grape]ALJ56401.1 Release factor glutamine methyltransferase [Candidatus Xiphinematobacter sp. Idaho Grape]
MTILDTLTSSSRYLAKYGVEDPQLNAEYLLAYILGKKRLELYLEFSQHMKEAECRLLWELVHSRAEHCPLQYLLGTSEFYGRQFFCDCRAMIPRQETELLVELALPSLLYLDRPIALLDVGTGSGVIAATLAMELPWASVDATDISPNALMLAAENLEKHRLAERVQLQQVDLLPMHRIRRYEAVFANLPYIPTEEIATLPLEVQHEPVEALDGGPRGIATIERLIEAAATCLHPGGWLWLEIGSRQKEVTISFLRKSGFGEINVHRDYNKFPRFVSARK